MLKGVFVLCSEGASTSFLCLPVSENTRKAGSKPSLTALLFLVVK